MARFGKSTRGGIAMMTALILPPLLIVALGAIELNGVLADKRGTQEIADAAALMGAQQLNVSPAGADARAQAFAQSQLSDVSVRATVTVTATILDAKTMKVAIDTHRDSFFGNLFPPGGFFTHAEATAAAASVTPLCVLVVGPGTGDDIHLGGSSTMLAPQCMVHSNHNVKVDGGAALAAYATEAGASASGWILPSASTGAPAINDPFANVAWSYDCSTGTTESNYSGNGTYHLPARVHANDVNASGNAVLILDKGEHYFCGNLNTSGNAQLQGDDVVLIFKDGKEPHWGGNNTSVSLNGRKSGALSGFVLMADRNYSSDFHVQSDSVATITGTIYVPSAKLMINGGNTGALSSAWTVLAAKAFDLGGSPKLTINANYTGSDVPVPYGVGNKRAPAYLKK